MPYLVGLDSNGNFSVVKLVETPSIKEEGGVVLTHKVVVEREGFQIKAACFVSEPVILPLEFARQVLNVLEWVNELAEEGEVKVTDDDFAEVLTNFRAFVER